MINIIPESYNIIEKNNEIIETHFKLENCPVGFANSIRRIILSNIPIVAFDDTWHNDSNKRNILIHKNSSAIHNEFLSHRISLLPIKMDKTDNLKIVTIFNQDNRIFKFKNKDNVPTFFLKIKNDNQTRIDRNTVGSIKVFSNDFTVKNKLTDIEEDINNYILADPYTNNYCVLDLIKTNILDDNEGEEIDLEAKPTIGIGLMNSRYTPVGTVSYSFEVDETRVDDVFNLQIEYKNRERTKKKIIKLSDNEVETMRNSFNLLGKERVFKCNKFGEANIFKFCVESIGFLDSNQLVMDSLYILELMLRDILNSIKFKEDNNEVSFSYNSKISVIPTYDELLGWNIIINNENHTIGNLISEYYKLLYCNEDPIDKNVITFAGYRMPHPLKEIIEIKLKLNSEIDLKGLYNNLINILLNKTLHKTNKNEQEIEHDLIIMIFIKTIQYILNDIDILINKWKELNKKSISPSFEINDNEQYFTHLNELGNQFTIDSIL